MRSRSKVLLAFGATCLSTAVLASGALAHNKHREGGEMSSKGTKALKVEVRGVITNITAPATPGATGLITLSAGSAAGFTWTCATPAGADLTMFTDFTKRVKATCRSAVGTGLTLTKLRHKDHGDKVKVKARGTITFSALGVLPATVTVDTGVTGQVPVVCAVTDKTRLRGNPITGDTAKVECKSKNGVLTAKKIEKKVVKVEARGTLAIATTGTPAVPVSVTVNGVTCSVPAGTVLPAVNSFVEIKCIGAAPNSVLAKIEVEDGDDD